jgi:hypothetical protein
MVFLGLSSAMPYSVPVLYGLRLTRRLVPIPKNSTVPTIYLFRYPGADEPGGADKRDAARAARSHPLSTCPAGAAHPAPPPTRHPGRLRPPAVPPRPRRLHGQPGRPRAAAARQ